MVMKRNVLLFLFLNVFLIGVMSAAVSISSCQELNRANTVYVLQNDVISIGSGHDSCTALGYSICAGLSWPWNLVCILPCHTVYSDYCFTITANNVTLDLNGHKINGKYGERCTSGSCSGIYITGSDANVKDGEIYNFHADVFVSSDSVNNNFINCLYNKEKVAPGSELFRKWYADVIVNDSNGYLENAEVNISLFVNSDNPRNVGWISRIESPYTSTPYSLAYPYSVFVSGNYAYVPSYRDNGLTIIDVSDRSNPFSVGWTKWHLNGPYSVFVSGNYAYVSSMSGSGLTILDVSDKSNPVGVGWISNSDPPYSLQGARDIFVSGNYVYVPSTNDGGLTILDVSDKSNPVAVGWISKSSPPYSLADPWSVFVSGNYAYVVSQVDDGLTILDVSDKSNPVAVGWISKNTPPYSFDGALDVFVSGNYAYVPSYYDDGLTIIDVTDKTNPTAIGWINKSNSPYSFDGALDIFVSGNYAYMTSADDSLTIIDVSDKSHPVAIDQISNSDPPYSLDAPYSVFVSGNYAYVVSTNDAGLTILDISRNFSPDIFSGLTNSLGRIPRQELAEYINRGGTRSYYPGYEFKVSYYEYSTNTAFYNLTETENFVHNVVLNFPGCSILDTPNSVFTLHEDIVTDETCFIVRADNVTIDLNDHSITGDGGSGNYAVYSDNSSGLTVKNGLVSNFGAGIYLYGVEKSFLTNLTSINNNYGVYFSGNSDYNIISDSYIYENNYGLYFASEDSLLPEYNMIYNNYFNNSENYFSSGDYVNYLNSSLTSGTNIIGGNLTGGNYWALGSGGGYSETCIDADYNKICDFIYYLSNNSYDAFALTYGGPLVCEGDTYFRGGYCVYPKVYWAYENGDEILSKIVSVNPGVFRILLVLETNPLLNGTEVGFTIKKNRFFLDKTFNSFNSVVGDDGAASVVWNITEHELDNIDNNDIYFKVNGDGIHLSSDKIKLKIIDCSFINICSDYGSYMGEPECSADSCGVAYSNPSCSGGGSCECVWDSGTSSCDFNNYEMIKTSCGDGLINQGEQCDSNNLAGITCGSFGYSGGQISCNSPGSVNECYFNVSGCTGLTEGVCGDEIINQDEQCDGANIFSGSDACSYFDSYNDGSVFCDNCLVNISSCAGGIGKVFSVGNCVYRQETNDNCEDGYLTYSSVGVWTWDEGNSFVNSQGESFVYDESDGMWHYDPDRLAESCREEMPTQVTLCPAKIQLPFFGIYSSLAIVIILILIYWILVRKRILNFSKKRVKGRKK
jgi:hypothetical protein